LKYLKQFFIILAFSLAGDVLETALPLPIPGAIYGFVLLFCALCAGLLKPAHIDETARFLIRIIGVFFVAPAVNILAYYKVIAPSLVPVCIIIISSTILVFGVSGLITQAVHKWEEKTHG
jgi:holin-like protein